MRILQTFREWPLGKVVMATLVFCVGAGILVSAYQPASAGPGFTGRVANGASFDPVLFALGLGICLVSGVVLLKAVQEYLK